MAYKDTSCYGVIIMISYNCAVYVISQNVYCGNVNWPFHIGERKPENQVYMYWESEQRDFDTCSGNVDMIHMKNTNVMYLWFAKTYNANW